MARDLMRLAKVVAAGLVLGSCAAADPWAEWRESAMLLDAPADSDTGSAYTDVRQVRWEQIFDD